MEGLIKGFLSNWEHHVLFSLYSFQRKCIDFRSSNTTSWGKTFKLLSPMRNLSLRTPIYIFLCLLEIVFPWKSYLDIKATYFLFFPPPPPRLSDGFLNQFPICSFSHPFTQLVATALCLSLQHFPHPLLPFMAISSPLLEAPMIACLDACSIFSLLSHFLTLAHTATCNQSAKPVNILPL